MRIFQLRDRTVKDYSSYVRSFIKIKDDRTRRFVDESLIAGHLWPDPLIQLNPSFEYGDSLSSLAEDGVLHPDLSRIFRLPTKGPEPSEPIRLHRHQSEAIHAAHSGHNYVLTTGTGSGKSLAYIVPIVDHVLRNGSGHGIQAIIVYPMNALANSQVNELQKFLSDYRPNGRPGIRFDRYTGQETDEERSRIIEQPPDILLTNFVMLELLLTRPREKPLITSARGLRFLVLDEMHTYRGRQGADVALLVRRVRDLLEATKLQCVGTSATLAGRGSLQEQHREIAQVASALFGASVRAEHVIGETLRRLTIEPLPRDPSFLRSLSERVRDADRTSPSEYSQFLNDPLASWVESCFGLTNYPNSARLVRCRPKSIKEAALELSVITGTAADRSTEAIKECLLVGYGHTNHETGFPVFAFRLHQFISRGDAVYASLDDESSRHITLQGQIHVPGDRSRALLPLVFCRACGQEYYCVRKTRDASAHHDLFIPRELSDRLTDDAGEPGFLYSSSDNPWPENPEDALVRLPADWLEDHRGQLRVRSSQREYIPKPFLVTLDGRAAGDGRLVQYIPAPFRFCLNCGISHGSRQQSDFAKLTSLGTEGRSTATTILSLSIIRQLRGESSLPPHARKLLSFTDNRQDASLQAGHFNDFIELGTLRAALYRACFDSGAGGITHDRLTQTVFDALALPMVEYSVDPDVRFQAKIETDRALRDVLGYRLYRDLKRGWRITSPNLEQCGLLEVEYRSLDELCGDGEVWKNRHTALDAAAPLLRRELAKALLDFMRQGLAVRVDYLDPNYQERLQQQSRQRLIQPWALDDEESLEIAAVLYPGSKKKEDFGGDIYLSPRGGYGQFVRRKLMAAVGGKLTLKDAQDICDHLLEVLRIAGLVERVVEAKGEDRPAGYQLPASAIVWKAGDGTHPFRDPIRVPNPSSAADDPNPFFVDFYRVVASTLKGIEAREHTAQVRDSVRQDRERRFRLGELPILYCSPTMELGVDIAELNVVNMRNVPPTPANYAQRSGRAGRSGNPAFVVTYCSTGSSHDQYFFKRPDQMVSGAVTPPRLDLANEDLVKAHIHAVWLTEVGQTLGNSLQDVLDLEGQEPSLKLKDSVRASILRPAPRERSLVRARRVLSDIEDDLKKSDWYSDSWVSDVLSQAALNFDRSCDRWRGLYRAALNQSEIHHRIIRDASRSADEKIQAKRLRDEAEAQLKLLADSQSAVQSDFYSYRYFASEGFLPGYNFPRLPLSAYIPGHRRVRSREEFLSRPRFLAISEFGPRAFIYHEGTRYIINRAILPVREEGVLTSAAKQCEKCGFIHPVSGGLGVDNCEHCGEPLPGALTNLFRLQNVATKRRAKISSDEEERLRLGYELRTGLRFAEYDGKPSVRTAEVKKGDQVLAKLLYGHAATLWRINLGWMRRADRNQLGFVLDTERGYWARNEQLAEDDDSDPMSAQRARVIPFVEDRRNCIIVEPKIPVDDKRLASLQAALKVGIQIAYQLEDSEIAAEPLPTREDRRALLFYEAAEGGAGVLRRLIEDPDAIPQLARETLRLCHFDPDTGTDLRRAVSSNEDCEAACYDCLMSYSNQMDHRLLDRQAILPFLRDLLNSEVISAPGPVPRAEHLSNLIRLCGSNLEKDWLRFLDERQLRLPDKAQVLVEQCKTRPDFVYSNALAAIYIDGPIHDFPDREKRDRTQHECMRDLGYSVIRFGHRDDWAGIIAKYPHIFGKIS